MRNFLILMAVASLGLAGLANAQCNPDPNEIGIFWSENCQACENCLDFVGGPTSAYVVLMNPSQPGGVSGYEFSLTNDDGSPFAPPIGSSIFIGGYFLPPSAINVDTAPSFIVGVAAPLAWNPCITLVQIDILVFSPHPWCFGVKPIIFPSIPGHMAYADGFDPGLILPMYPITGPDATDYKMACLNSPDCPIEPVATEESSWGSLKSLYR